MSDQRYHLLEKLESGGMAEVFLGEATSVQGFKKRVAIKRVLPHLASHTNFIGMFLDEARLGARLSHANIVSVFDIGKSDNSFFIVMEFVDGTNLKKIIETLRVKGESFPLKDVLYIAMETCRGLSYAHELVDDDGHPVDLVHRDVSPPNILISKRGEVKVTDFGLAKARTQLERTDPGVVKGKFSYLSPEVATGQDVDERADIFALGVCVWEMLAGRRLFLGDTDYETVQAVSNANVPSLVGVHPEVDRPGGVQCECAEPRRSSSRGRPADRGLDPQGARQGSRRPFSDGARVRRCARGLPVPPSDEGDVVRHRQSRQSRPRTPKVGAATTDDDRRHDSRRAWSIHVARERCECPDRSVDVVCAATR
ncbi:MAG: serine/threonine protein kinase [Deltaproteobacteria bacterium]|nr:serine/threonine protein kinase [Deltaproteobacteria bacterium]